MDERRYEAELREEGWVTMSVDGVPTSRPKAPSPVEVSALRQEAIFPEWHAFTKAQRDAVREAWMYFCNDLDAIEISGEDARDQEAVIDMLDRFYAGLVEHMDVKKPLSIVAVLAGEMGYDISGARAVLSVVVQDQIALMDLVRRLKSNKPPSGPPETLWEVRHGMVDLKSRKRAAMKLLRKHRMLKDKE
jgi:hypothetical protein